MKNFYLLVISIFILVGGYSQVNYAFSTATGTYVALTAATASVLTAADPNYGITDEGYQNGINIGFPFNYNGTVYNTIHINTNGFASFTAFTPIADTDAEAYYFDDLENGPYVTMDTRPILAPLWDDLDMASASNIRYTTTGTSPNRVFIVEWANAHWDYSASAPVVSFQLRLYEGTRVVEFIYRSEAGARAQDFSDGASIGITSSQFGNGSYISLNNFTASPATSSTDSSANITSKPATGQIYRFTPTSAFPISLTNFKGERINNLNKLTWTTASEQNNKGFELQRSADGKNFSSLGFISSKAANGNSTSPLQYSFDDLKPFRSNVFYRLKQLDKDDAISYSSVVFLKGAKSTRLEIRNIFPNPAISRLGLLIATAQVGTVSLIVSDLNGKIVMQNNVGLVSGDNMINLNVAKLPAGSYTIKALCNNGCDAVSAKFVKH